MFCVVNLLEDAFPTRVIFFRSGKRVKCLTNKAKTELFVKWEMVQLAELRILVLEKLFIQFLNQYQTIFS